MSSSATTVVGIFNDRHQADLAVDELRQAGFRRNQIGVVTRDAQGKITTTNNEGDETYAEEGAVAGAIAGAGVGGLVGLGVLSGVIPVIGPAIAAGTLGTILLNAAGGAAIAGIVGALVGMGIPEEEAKHYEGELKAGRTLVTVRTSQPEEARTILRRHGAGDMHTQAAGVNQQTTRRTRGTSESAATGKTIEVCEEELHPHKQSTRKGEVRVRKEVKTEQKTLEVPVTREEVVVERHPTRRRATEADMQTDEEIRIPVHEEEVFVEKRPVVKEEITVGKRRVRGTERVSGTVRKERARIEQEGDIDVRSKTTPKR